MITLVCFVLAAATLGIGGWLTEIGAWYYALRVPPWKPPNWAFGPVWTLIGICAALSAAGAWRAAVTTSARREIAVLFGINALFNIGWSLFFFKWRRPDWALIEVAGLWLSVLAPIVLLWPIHHNATYLLLPYLVWVSIAAALNAAVVRMNAPFDDRAIPAP